MRYLTSHAVNPANDKLLIKVLDEPGPGGANHAYLVTGMYFSSNPSGAIARDAHNAEGGCLFVFQNGAIGEAGVNGITHEVMLAILIDRLEAFQDGPYANAYNQTALSSLTTAQEALLARTRHRQAQGIEGTMAKGEESKQPETQRGHHGLSPTSDPSHKGKDPEGNPIMQYFAYMHLPIGVLRGTSRDVADLAVKMNAVLPASAEKSAGLRKLLEAKDCFVRAALVK